MAITVTDFASEQESAGVPNVSVTVGSSNPCVVVLASPNSGDPDSCQVDGANASFVFDPTKGYFGQDLDIYIQTGVASGLRSVTYSKASGPAGFIAAISLEGVDQETPIRGAGPYSETSGASAAPSISSVPSAVDDMLIFFGVALGEAWSGTPSPQIASAVTNNNEGFVMEAAISAGASVTRSYTLSGSGSWGLSAISLIPASGGGGGGNPSVLLANISSLLSLT